MFVVVIPGILWFVGTYEPVKLSIVQEQVLGFLHGGIVNEGEQVTIDGCVEVQGRDGLWAVRRVNRIVKFADGSSLSVIYSSPPERNPQCQ